jgi:hypothetical protein
MGRKYTARVSGVTVPATNAFDVFELLAPSTSTVKIKEIVAGISGTADFGDAQAEGLDMQFLRGIGATSGSGGSTPTPQPHETGDAAADVTVEASNTTVAVAGGGSLTAVRDEPWNVQMGFRYTPPDGLEFTLSPGERFVCRIPTGPSDELTTSFHASITFEETGG